MRSLPYCTIRVQGVAALILIAGGLAADATAFGQAATLPPPQSAMPIEPGATNKTPDNNDGRCDICGSRACVRKLCVPKPKEREIKKVCWGYKCEDFCIPGPSEYCGKKCGKDECGCWSYDVWKPTCAHVRTKKVPVRKEVKRKVPGVEWKLEERCEACRGTAGGPSCAASP